MKTLNTVLKLLSAIATLAGVIYLIATYGDQIVAWAKEMMAKCPCMNGCEEPAAVEEEAFEEAAPAEEAAEASEEETAPAEEPTAEEPAAAEAPSAEDGAPVADEEDFEA